MNGQNKMFKCEAASPPDARAVVEEILRALGSAQDAQAGRERLEEIVRNALQGAANAGQRTEAPLSASETRALVRDLLAEELDRYWERRFGGRP